jgi:hypothetical protein
MLRDARVTREAQSRGRLPLAASGDTAHPS